MQIWTHNSHVNFPLKFSAIGKKFQKTSGDKTFWLTLYSHSTPMIDITVSDHQQPPQFLDLPWFSRSEGTLNKLSNSSNSLTSTFSVLLPLEATFSEHRSRQQSGCLAVDVVPELCTNPWVHPEWLVCGWFEPAIAHWTQSTGLTCPAVHQDRQTSRQILRTLSRQQSQPCINNHYHCRCWSSDTVHNLSISLTIHHCKPANWTHTMCAKNETRINLNFVYSCKSIAIKFSTWYPDDLSHKIHT